MIRSLDTFVKFVKNAYLKNNHRLNFATRFLMQIKPTNSLGDKYLINAISK